MRGKQERLITRNNTVRKANQSLPLWSTYAVMLAFFLGARHMMLQGLEYCSRHGSTTQALVITETKM